MPDICPDCNNPAPIHSKYCPRDSKDALRERCEQLESEFANLYRKVAVYEELLLEITDWYGLVSVPNNQFAYYSCPICHTSWWGDNGLFGKPRHTFKCWVPSLEKLINKE